jgi:hypothetical protein
MPRMAGSRAAFPLPRPATAPQPHPNSSPVQLAEHVCGSDHDSGDKCEHAGKQHNVDDELDHDSPPKLTPEIKGIPSRWRQGAKAVEVVGRCLLDRRCVLGDTVRKYFDGLGSDTT